MISGHITVCKVYKDGTEEMVLDKANLVTAGLGSSFLDIQQNAGSDFIGDYTPRYFQVGTGVIGWSGTVREASSTFYQLSAPFSWQDYGLDTDIELFKRYRGFNASTVDGGVSYTELLNTSAALSAVTFSGEDQYFGQVTEGRVSKFFVDSFESEIVLDENSGNGKSISEVGLFAKNPKGFGADSPLLMAYKNFDAIDKTADYSLVIHWSIGFLGISTQVDEHYTGHFGNTEPDLQGIRGQNQPKGGPPSIQ
jgi:hypothetical protein